MSLNLYKIIDELRKLQGISVAELCDGIIQERTYYRYLESTRKPALSLFNTLIKRLKLETVIILVYITFFREDVPLNDYLRLIYRVFCKKYDDIDKYYIRLKNELVGNNIVQHVVDTYILKYEFDTGILNKDQYLSSLRAIIAPNTVFDIGTIFAPLFIYVTSNGDCEYSEDFFYDFITKDNFAVSPALSIYLYDSFIGFTLFKSGYFQRLQTVLDKFNYIVPFLNISYIVGHRNLYDAYILFIKNDDSYKKYLAKFINSALTLYVPTVQKELLDSLLPLFKQPSLETLFNVVDL